MSQSYAAYRDSGVDWLGRIPEHWQDQRLKTTVERSDIRVEPAQSETAPYVGLEHVASQTGRLLGSDDELGPTGLSNAFACGDVLFGKLRPYLAKAFCAEFDGLCSTEFLILRPQRYERRYLLHLLLTSGFVSHVDSSTFGARMPRTDWEFVGDSVLPVPPQREQAAIAGYLDRETARIDKLIRMQESLIERLDEYRTALVTRVVTKGLPPEAAEAAGLDPAPALKDSGVEWLGEVPEHWAVSHLRRFVTWMKTGTTPTSAELSESAGDDIAWLSPGDIGSVLELKPPSRSLANKAIVDGLVPIFPAESTVIVGIGATAGRVGHTEQLSTGNQQLTCIVGNDRVFPRFLSWQLWAQTQAIRAIAPFATLPILNNEFLLSLPFTAPSPREQQAIASYLDAAVNCIDAVCAKGDLSIERLREYRSALISAAVTGKIDVRDGALAGSGVGGGV